MSKAEIQAVEKLRAERKALLAESERLLYPWQRRRRRELRRRAEQLREQIIGLLYELPAEVRGADAIERFCEELRADGRLFGRLEAKPDPTKSDPDRYLITYEGSQQSFVSIPPRPWEELSREQVEGWGRGYRFHHPGPQEFVVAGEYERAADWRTAIGWVRADLLAATYGRRNPHPAYLREREEIARQRENPPALEPPPPGLLRTLAAIPQAIYGLLVMTFWGRSVWMSFAMMGLNSLLALSLMKAGLVALGAVVFIVPTAVLVLGLIAETIDSALIRPRKRLRGERVWWPLDEDGCLRLTDLSGKPRVLSALDRRLIREGELMADGRRRQTLIPHDLIVSEACRDERPADAYVPSIEGSFAWVEGADSPRQRKDEKRMLGELAAAKEGLLRRAVGKLL